MRESSGPAWRELSAKILSQDRALGSFRVPAVEEVSLLLVRQGQALVEERESDGDWVGTWVKPGDLFLTAPGSAYELRIRPEGAAPLVTFHTTLELALLARAGEEVFGSEALPRLESLSCFRDSFVEASLRRLEEELNRGNRASGLLLQGLGQALAVHLIRRHTQELAEPELRGGLAGHLLLRLAEVMKRDLRKPFSLKRYARLAGMSESHLSRAFKQSTGLPPSRYAIRLRIEEAKRLLRETRESALQVALAVGYESPSHFAQIFRRETGLTPMEYRRRA